MSVDEYLYSGEKKPVSLNSLQRIAINYDSSNEDVDDDYITGYDDNQNEDSRQRRKRSHNSASKTRLNNKIRRMKGQSYFGFSTTNGITMQNCRKQKKKMGLTCNSAVCRKSQFRNCQEFTEETRNSIFESFWSMCWETKKVFVKDHIAILPKKVSKHKTSKKINSFEYNLPLNNGSVQVCQKMFLSTLSLGIRTVRGWICKKVSPIRQQQTTNEKQTNSKKYLQQYFRQLDTVKSHYCRKDTNKTYIAAKFKTKADIFKDYNNYCTINGVKAVSIYTFYKVFESENLSLYMPRKDQCDTCVGYQVKQVSEEVYIAHVSKKDRAQLEKARDKRSAQDGHRHVLTMDAQAVKLCPDINASAIYYKQRLQIHNFTIYNLGNHGCNNYWWSENNGDLSASSFISCIIHHLKSYCLLDSLPITIFSDGCGYQNRNHFLSNALSLFAIKNNKIVEQKFLEKGHTQMECDSAHAKIEKKLKNQHIYMPNDYVNVTKEARKTVKVNNAILQKSFEAVNLNYDFFMNYNDEKLIRFSSIRPGRTKNDPTVSNLRSILYLPNGEVKFKINFDDEYTNLPTRIKPYSEETKPTHLHSGSLPIHPNKWKQLQELKKVIPPEYHSFYDNLKQAPK